ncbi:MAG: hypothetical protein HC836_48670 [Richelia sp. RM2_1_2]|nr:hypothetical protein [Richelia sp. RM2_1_2]
MLIETSTSIKKDDIVVFKTISGDEVIGKLVEVKSNGDLTIKKPLSMQLVMGPAGQGGVAMVPFMLGADENASFVFKSDHVIAPVKANANATSGYIQNTTGLAMPTVAQPKDLHNLRG